VTIGSIFSGVGGLDLAVESVTGGSVVWQAETDPYAAAVLARRWPSVPNLGDVRFLAGPPAVDVLCGGFPCQDISSAGKRKGIEGERSGLWTEFARLIRQLGPGFVFVENVSSLRGRGLDTVLGDLAALGFDAEWTSLTAASVGAPHRRDRLFLLAYSDRHALRELAERRQLKSAERRHGLSLDACQHVADADELGRKGHGEGNHVHWSDARWGDVDGRDSGLVFPPRPDDGEGWARWIRDGGPAPGVRRSAYGASDSVDARRRRGRLRCLGNGVVARQAAAAFLSLLQRGIET